ncbi:hypothetical protein PIB30_053473 [Stylosanthes scabra]|uniref:SKP1 component POZ domain-containing protein n=1 Tax=Stylosanthes scabra TaxID=79078 RepID=A0ABU6WGN1_9FABA|nr:hypothetical protein [Stylosanthes scabra]
MVCLSHSSVSSDSPMGSLHFQRNHHIHYKSLLPEMGTYFGAMRRNTSRFKVNVIASGDISIDLKDMLLNDRGMTSYEYLRNSNDLAKFAAEVYCEPYIYPGRESIQLRSSDKEVLEIDKSLAESESALLMMIDDEFIKKHGAVEVPQVSAEVLKEVILFLEKKRDFEQASKVVGKVLGEYKSWSTYFINRNADIMPQLNKAAKELCIQSLLALTSKKAYKRLRYSSLELRDLNACESQQMFHYLISLASDPKRREAVLIDLDQSCYDPTIGSDTVVACENFIQWFTKVWKLVKPLYEDFENLMKSPQFKEICLSLYKGKHRVVMDQISLRSCDGHDLMMDKSVATAESVFLHDRVDSNRGMAPIDVPADRDVLSQVIDFCHKKQDFHEIIEGLETVNPFKRWVTFFLKRNEKILSNLNEAADYLYIPSLLVLTANELGNSVERTLEEALWWCKKVSLSPILLSLFAWDL